MPDQAKKKTSGIRRLLWLTIFSIVIVVVSCRNRCQPTELIWKPDDLEGMKIAADDSEATFGQHLVTLHQKPPFYNGPIPLKHTSLVFELFPASMGSGGIIVVRDEYAEFETDYIYPDEMKDKLSGIPIGAVTVSKSSKEVVAEARVINIGKGGIVLEEFHYHNCAGGIRCCLFFKAKSFVNGSGYKEREQEANGTKEKDYYFNWPTSPRF